MIAQVSLACEELCSQSRHHVWTSLYPQSVQWMMEEWIIEVQNPHINGENYEMMQRQSLITITNYVFHIIYTHIPEKAMATHSSTLAWKIPRTEEPGRLHSMGSLRVGHDWATSLSLFTFMHWRRKWQLTPVFLPGENPRDGGAWWAAVYGVAQGQTWLKQLSSSSSIHIYK